MALKYNPAADAISVAYCHFKDGDLKGALTVMASAFELEGMDELTDSLNVVNASADQDDLPSDQVMESFDESDQEEEIEDSDDDQDEDLLEEEDDGEFTEPEIEDDEETVESAVETVLSETEEDPDFDGLFDDDEETYGEDEETQQTEEVESSSDEDLVEEEDFDESDDSEIESPIESAMKRCQETSAFLKHIAVANKASIAGDAGSRNLSKKLLKSAQ